MSTAAANMVPTFVFSTLTFALLISVSGDLAPTVRAVGEWEACSGKPGVCIDVDLYQCSTSAQSGLCPGGSSIRCCPYPGGVEATSCATENNGVCTLTSDCQGTSKSGKCPGPSHVTCCSGASDSCTLGSANSCDTGIAAGLTAQLVAELSSMGISFDTLKEESGIKCKQPCQPYLQSAARISLEAATVAEDDSITLNSAYRSSAQQYLLYSWKQAGICNIPAAAKPGTSRHEGGLAIDTSFYDFWMEALTSRMWKWFGAGDRVHFTFVGAGTVDVRKDSLIAFQRLWNKHNPFELLVDDGVFGPNTAAKLNKAPCNGW